MKVILDAGAYAPVRNYAEDAGIDIKSPISCTVPKRGSKVIDTGVHVGIPYGYVGMLKSKSGLNVKHGITSEGVIDAGYTGSIVVKLYNNGDEDYHVDRGDKITQLVVMPIYISEIYICDRFAESDLCGRGNNGFGSTGK